MRLAFQAVDLCQWKCKLEIYSWSTKQPVLNRNKKNAPGRLSWDSMTCNFSIKLLWKCILQWTLVFTKNNDNVLFLLHCTDLPVINKSADSPQVLPVRPLAQHKRWTPEQFHHWKGKINSFNLKWMKGLGLKPWCCGCDKIFVFQFQTDWWPV